MPLGLAVPGNTPQRTAAAPSSPAPDAGTGTPRAYARRREGDTGAPRAGRARWVALAVVSAVNALDSAGFAIANTALPDLDRSLRMGPALLPWVMTAYALAFAGFLLFGGRAADVLGRRRMLLGGVAVYAAGAAVAAFAPAGGVLVAGRALQGVGAALSGPPALALVAAIFTDTRERARAMGVFVAISASSFAGALVVGGVLTSAAGWRTPFLALLAVAATVGLVGTKVLPRDTARTPGGLDLPGAALITAGLMALVYGVSQAEHASFGSVPVLGPVAAAAALLAAFVVRERLAAEPLLPLGLLRLRTVRAATVSGVVFYTTMVGLLFFAPLYLQGVRGYSPLLSGLAVAPMGLTVAASTPVAAAAVSRLGQRRTLATGFTVMAAGLAAWTLIGTGTGYFTVLLPGLVVMSFGQTLAYTAMMSAALTGVEPARHGVAGAVNITAQQIGSGLGTAVLATVAAAATGPGTAGLIHGYRAGVATAAAIGLLGALAAVALLRRDRTGA
ncbi:MFS transporter [Streptomyces sp. NPDC021224]|uniref:MFS transporter n=1 Tax=unclassified Streptomyces TaxID=2593676 RepID=UPI0037BD870B